MAFWIVSLLLTGLLHLPSPLKADTPPDSRKKDEFGPDLVEPRSSKDLSLEKETPRPGYVHDASIQYAYAPGAEIKSGGGDEVNEQDFQLDYGARIPWNDALKFGFGVHYDRLDFGGTSGSGLPDNLQSISIRLGFDHKITEEWGAFAFFSPALNLVNGGDEIDSGNFQMRGALGATYKVHKDLHFRFGLMINPGLDDLPVLPIGGVYWHFADQWTLQVGIPETAIRYQVLPKLGLALQAKARGGNYRTGGSYGTSLGRPLLNDRTLNYTEIRVGGAAQYDFTENVSAELSTGVIAYRKFEFEDSGYEPEVEPGPYFGITVKSKF